MNSAETLVQLLVICFLSVRSILENNLHTRRIIEIIETLASILMAQTTGAMLEIIEIGETHGLMLMARLMNMMTSRATQIGHLILVDEVLMLRLAMADHGADP